MSVTMLIGRLAKELVMRQAVAEERSQSEMLRLLVKRGLESDESRAAMRVAKERGRA